MVDVHATCQQFFSQKHLCMFGIIKGSHVFPPQGLMLEEHIYQKRISFFYNLHEKKIPTNNFFDYLGFCAFLRSLSHSKFF
jgi:hypothetical protein